MSLLFFMLVLYLYEMRNCNSDCKDLTFDCLLIKRSIKLASEIQYRLIELGKTLFMFFLAMILIMGVLEKEFWLQNRVLGFKMLF